MPVPGVHVPVPGVHVPGVHVPGVPVPGVHVPGVPVPGVPVSGVPVPAPGIPAPPVPGVPPAVALPSPLTELADDRLARVGVRLYLKRDDLISPDFPGNKWRKLSLNLDAAGRAGCTALGTFGGAYSNHIRAVAAAGQRFGFATIGVIRGEEHLPLNPSLRAATARGMRLIYMDRATYRRKTEPAVIEALRDRLGDFYLLPEGGSNGLAARGCTRIPAEIGVPFDVICCACGTGGTLAGVAAGLHGGQRALAFPRCRVAAGSSRRRWPRCRTRGSAVPRGNGTSTTGSTLAGLPGAPPNWTASSPISPAATASPWTGSTWPR